MSLRLFGNTDKALSSGERKMVKFAVSDIMCAVDIMNVREIIQPRATSPLPSHRRTVIGVIDHRDAAIPVIDLRIRFDVPQTKGPKQKWIIIALEERRVALVVDNVFGVTTVQLNQQRDHSSLSEETDVSWAENVYGDESGLLFELDLEHLSQLTGAK
ncbi:MAG: chemotaxis protein CheW [Deltaproteobacteria bacterium]|nr:chemotaxis protein CheW [Deltaproteobacteria bacterium]MBN2672821.1 chemotaxis protein CheW [Deltaproteobacteria bacterium]